MNYEKELWKEDYKNDDAYKVFTFAEANHVIVFKPSVVDDLPLIEKFSKFMYTGLFSLK